MSESHSSNARAKSATEAIFNALAPTYDSLRFLHACARGLVHRAALGPGLRVLDVATGTGAVALAAADIVRPGGKVVGVDLAAKMVARARQKVTGETQAMLEFRQGDAGRLEFPDQSFDVVLCASSLFFVPDMGGALAEWRRVLAPSGRVGFSCFGPGFLQPARSLWDARLQRHGLTPAALPTNRLSDRAVCEALLDAAGFTGIEVSEEQLGYPLLSAEERWADIQAGPEGGPLLALGAHEQEQVRNEHLDELRALIANGAGWVDVPTLFAFGARASAP
jgi:ubiquinone/menaquinone biosynthesis C-methylase UbiE